MKKIISQKPSFVISEIILNQEGKFIVEDILNKVENIISEQFETTEALKKYIIKKLDSMCYYGLIGRTNVYYFSF